MTEPIEIRDAQVGGVDFGQRIIELLAVPYEQETVIYSSRANNGRPLREMFERGAFDGIESRNQHVTVNRDHSFERTVGKVVGYKPDDPRGLVADIQVSDTELGRETLTLARDGVLRASVGFAVRDGDSIVMRGLRRIRRAFLDHIALVPRPAYEGTKVLAVRTDDATPRLNQIIATYGRWVT